MDHCTQPRNPIHSPIRIPFLGFNPEYEPPFEHFDKHCQWTEEELYHFQFERSERSFGDVDPFVQSWLFFGLIEETLGPLSKHYRTPNCVFMMVDSSMTEQSIINTWILRKDFDVLQQAFNSLGADNKEAYKQCVTAKVNMVYNILRKHLDQTRRIAFKPSMAGHPGARQSLVNLSIGCLCAYLSSLFGLHDATRFSRFEYLEQGVLEGRLLDDGWCPSQVKRVSRALLPTSLYLLSNMRRPDPHLDHGISDIATGRKRCTEHQCFANQVRLKDYTTKHDAAYVHDGNGVNCEFFATEQMQMFEWLKKGILPLTLYTDDPPKLYIVPSTTHTRYVAISHVWAQGLGNQDSNALPRCQLKRLSMIVNQLYPPSYRPVPFWIDTLSCPTEPKEARSLAIIQMRNTYSRADKVLVLDSYLDVESVGMSNAEILLRILCSGWTTRLWTFQEGALARDAYFRFRDAAVNGTAIREHVRIMPQAQNPDLDEMLEELGLGWFSLEARPSTVGQLVIILARAVRHRATSVAEDEALCLGSLAGIDMETLANPKVPPRERMRIFWESFEAPPSMLVFWEGKNLNEIGYRWAPASFLGLTWAQIPGVGRSSFYERMSREHTKLIKNSGLEINAPGLLLGVQTGNIGDVFWVRIERDIWLYISCCGDEGFQRKDESEILITKGAAGNDDAELTRAGTSLAIILQNEMEPLVLDQYDKRSTAYGLLAVAERPAAGRMKVTPLMDVFVVSASSCMAEEEELLFLKEMAKKLDQWTRPVGRCEEVLWRDPFSKEGLVEWRNRNGADWWELDDTSIVKGDRWNYGYDGKHYIFQGLSLSSDQAWCVT